VKKISLLLLVLLPAAAQDLRVPCEPSAGTLRLLEAVAPPHDTAIPYEQRVGALRKLASQHPSDFFIQRAYQDSFRQNRTLGDEFDRALAMYHARPSDPLSRYYQARLTLVSDPHSQQVLTDYVAANPDFAWPHRDLIDLAMLPGRRSAQETTAQLDAFNHSCPGAFGAPDRDAVERRNTPVELTVWPAIWKAEEKSPDIASRIRTDLKRIDSWPFRPDPNLYFVYEEAARFLKDPGVLKLLRARVDRESPGSLLALNFIEEDWQAANPPPDRNAGATAWNDWQEKQRKTQRELVGRFPNAWHLIVSPLMSMSSDKVTWPPLTPADLEFIDQALRVHAASPDAGEVWPPVENAIATIYVGTKTRLDRVPALLDTSIRAFDQMYKYEISPELVPEEMRKRLVENRQDYAERMEGVRVDYLLAAGRASDARPLIEQVLARLDAAGVLPQTISPRQDWNRRLGRADASENRIEDALRHYQASFSGWSKSILAIPQIQVAASEGKQYYLAHGGSEEKWLEWATAVPAVSKSAADPLSLSKALPEFSAADLHNHSWTLASFKGKATLVVFWATWCGPCRSEHPGIQELYDRIKDRKDLQVLTISVDDGIAEVRQYMEEHNYTFPVVHSAAVADKLFPWAGLPTSFLVNPRAERSGMYPIAPDSTYIGSLMDTLGRLAKSNAH
jgi:thiol-disulfide isomerase/thioredoxin